ncbi:MAG TPA: hypothetical protein VKV26_22560 [Dehalococcoidia bacterium]|nr:hypothetical protein [Dehalococcoidia bacterium]
MPFDPRRWFGRTFAAPPARRGAGRAPYLPIVAALLTLVAVIAIVAAAVRARSGGSASRTALQTTAVGGIFSPTPPVPAATATPEPDTAAASAVALVAGFPGAIAGGAGPPPAPSFPTPPTVPGLPAALAPGQATPPPGIPAGAAQPPSSVSAGVATPPVLNPPPSGIPTPPVGVPPPVVVNAAPAINSPPISIPVVQSVAAAPPGPLLVSPPPAAQAARGAMLLTFTVRAADRPDALVSPTVRVFANGQECADATGTGSILVELALPESCAQTGDLLSFEAGGLDSRAAAASDPTPACPFELQFDPAGQPAPAYQAVMLAAGPRFVTLILAALPDCPAPGAAATAAPSTDTTLTLGLLQMDTPGAPLERPTVTAYVGGAACARSTALAGTSVVLTLPERCGQPGTAVALRASALDVRYPGGGDTAGCSVAPPPLGVSVPDFQPTPLPIAMQPGSALAAALLLGDCAATPAAATASPTAATTTLIPATSPAATATPAPTSPPAATPTRGRTPSIAPASTPNSTPATPAATPTPAVLNTPDAGGSVVFVTPPAR